MWDPVGAIGRHNLKRPFGDSLLATLLNTHFRIKIAFAEGGQSNLDLTTTAECGTQKKLENELEKTPKSLILDVKNRAWKMYKFMH